MRNNHHVIAPNIPIMSYSTYQSKSPRIQQSLIYNVNYYQHSQTIPSIETLTHNKVLSFHSYTQNAAKQFHNKNEQLGRTPNRNVI